MELYNVVSKFNISGKVIDISTFGAGLINSTYKVETESNSTSNYILQTINNDIFKNVPQLTNNIVRVTEHIKRKLNQQYSSIELDRHSLTVIYTNDGEGFFKDEKGIYWRMFLLIEGSKTIEILENAEQAEDTGRAFGEFQELLTDLPEPKLFDVLPGFHNTAMRIENLKIRVKKDPCNRLAEVKEEVEYLLQFEDEMKSIVKKGEEGILPLRIVHQDTKLSNILFDENNDPLCVIDLDTVMPGYLCYDFGDAVRGGMNTGKEDDEDLSNISINMELFKGFAKGYSAATKNFITKEETDTLVFGARLLTYEQSVRFLDDYLNGDKYYKTLKDKHNLIRTRAQIAYFKDLTTHYKEMDKYVKDLYKRY